jgi:hypothetical protein
MVTAYGGKKSEAAEQAAFENVLIACNALDAVRFCSAGVERGTREQAKYLPRMVEKLALLRFAVRAFCLSKIMN